MSFTSQVVALTDTDKKIIRSVYAKIQLVLVLIFILFTGFGIGITVWKSDAIPLIIISAFDLGILVGFYFVYRLVRKEIDAGTKSVITGTLSEKKEKTTTTTTGSGTSRRSNTKTEYMFVFGDMEISVYRNQYVKYQAGDKLEVSVSAVARMVIDIKLLEEAPVKSTFKNAHSSTSDFTTSFEREEAVMLDNELECITHIRNRRLVYTTLWSVSLGFLSYWILLIVLVLISTSDFVNDKIAFILIGRYVLTGLVLLVLTLVFVKRVLPYIRDVRSMKKQIERVTIDDKIRSNVRLLNKNWRMTTSRGDFCYLVAHGKYYQVNPKAFDAFETNDMLKIHKAWFSGKLLSVEGKGELISLV